jgi:glycosyltransferase involved in cell wall biosynthesis
VRKPEILFRFGKRYRYTRKAAVNCSDSSKEIGEAESVHSPRTILFLLRKVDCNDGIAAYCDTLITGLRGSGDDVLIVSGPVSFTDSTVGRRDSLLADVSSWLVLAKLSPVPRISQFLEVLRLIRTRRVRIIHAHGLSLLLWGRTLALLSGAVVVVSYHPSAHGSLENVRKMAEQAFSPLRRLYLKLFYPDALIVLSEENRNLFAKALPNVAARTHKIHGGIDHAHFRPPSAVEREAARRRFGYQPTDFVCLLSGRLSWVKGHDVLLKAYGIIRARHVDLPLKCLFAGSGDHEPALRALAAEQDGTGESINFAGFLQDPREAIWAADVMVLPSRIEGFALAVAEGMAAGLVPVRTPSGGAMDQIIDGKTGFLVPFEDASALADKLILLSDERLRRKMAENAIIHARCQFSAEAMVSRIGALYGELVMRKTRRAAPHA